MIAGSEKLLRRLIGEQIKLTVDLEPGVLAIKADANQLEQVLMNLAVNAKDAMPAGGRLTIRTSLRFSPAEPNQSAVTGDLPPFAEMQVTDTGEGMPKSIQARIFEPFFTTKSVGKGSGLGLSVVHGIVQQHEGRIGVNSQPGTGTTFTIQFPIIAGTVHRTATNSETLSQPGTETILLVEDEEGVRKMARAMLESQGYRVIDAPNGRVALEITRNATKEIDLLVTDVVMPETGGRQLANDMRMKNPGLPVLYISGYHADASIRATRLNAQESFLKKPFNLQQLVAAVRQAIEKSDKPTVRADR